MNILIRQPNRRKFRLLGYNLVLAAKFSFATAVLSILVACNNQQNTTFNASGKKIRISFDNLKEQSDEFVKSIDSLKAIKLESDSVFLIGSVDKVVFSNNRIYIFDKRVSQAIFVFTLNGKKLFKIQRTGKGPGEYVSPGDMIVDANAITVLDSGTGKLISYDLEGKFVNEINLKYPADRIEKLDKTAYTAFTNNYGDHNVFILDGAGKKLNEYFNVPGYLSEAGFAMQKNFSIFKDEVLLANALDNNFYRTTKDSLSTKYTVDFDKYNIPRDLLTSSSDFNVLLKKVVKSGYAFGIDYMNETDNYVNFLFIIKDKGGVFNAYYNKGKDKCVVVSNPTISKDWQIIRYGSLSTYNSYFVNAIPASEIIKFIEKPTDYPQLNQLKREIGKVNELDNPVLILHSYKN